MSSAFMTDFHRGFSLAEVLLSLTVLMTALIILVPLMEQLKPGDSNKDWAAHQFIQLLQEELNNASHIQTDDSFLQLTNRENETITIERYQNLIRRRVSGKGHEVLLYEIDSVNFLKDSGGIRMKVSFEGGGKFDKTFFIPEK